MEEQKKPSTSTSQGGGGGGEGGGRRGDDVDEERADDQQQLSPATNVVDDNVRNDMEKGRLNQDLSLSNDLIRDRRLRPFMNFFDLKETKMTSTSSSTSQGGRSGGDVSGQRKRKRSAVVVPVRRVDDDEERRRNIMAYLSQAVFSNTLITTSIWPHLNFADLKVTRGVSQGFFDEITRSRSFKTSAVLLVSKESLEVAALFDKTSSMMTKTWHGIQIDVDLPLEIVDKIRHILETVQFVSLLTSRFKIDTDDESSDELRRDESYAKFIAGVLCSTPKLSCLQMDIRFLANNLSSVWTSPTIRHHLKNLDSLELPHFGHRHHSKVYGTTTSGWKINLRDSEFTRNLAQLETVLRENGPRLKTLCFPTSIDDSTRYSVLPRQAPPITTSFAGLLQSHRESLVKISFSPDVWSSSDALRWVTMPHLKSLTTIVTCFDTVNFESFLTNHPKLEELDVCINEDGGTGRWEQDDELRLWEAIKRRCLATTDTLKKLYLKMSRIFLLCSGAEDGWGFLEEMKALEEFQFDTWYNYNDNYVPDYTQGRCGSGILLLEKVPRTSQKLERLSLNGMGVGCNFWNFTSSDPQDEGRREGLALVTEVPTKLEYLQGFQNLKRLSFRHSPNALDDDVIQFIFREMTALEELEVSHCPRLTDAGISGTGPRPEEEKRVSIQSLKDLKVLSIRACPSVTPKGLLSVLALPLLQHFDYFSSSPVPKSFVHGIAGQNPSLESISVRSTFFSGDSSEDPGRPNPSSLDMDNNSMVDFAWSIEDKKAFFKKYPRIKALNNLETLKRDLAYVWWT